MAAIVGNARAGDPGAFEDLYRLHIGRVSQYLRAALRDLDDVQDVSQAVFLKVFEALPRFRTGEQPFDHWLFAIVRNATIDHRASVARSLAVAPGELDLRRDGAHRDDAEPPWGWSAELQEALATLPPAQRQVIVLHYLGGLSAREIASTLGITSEYARQLKRRALRRLRARLPAPLGGRPAAAPSACSARRSARSATGPATARPTEPSPSRRTAA